MKHQLPKDYNSYGQEEVIMVMMRGTFANIRIRNEKRGRGGHKTLSHKIMPVYDA